MDDTDAESSIADEEEVHVSVHFNAHYTSCSVYKNVSTQCLCALFDQLPNTTPIGDYVLFEHMSYIYIVLAGCTTGEGH